MKITLPARYDKLSNHEKRWVRFEYIRRQNGKCWYCGQDLNNPPPKEITDKPIRLYLFPKGFLDNPIHLQHDHGTGMTEGAVHAYCNAVLWDYYGR